MASKNSGSSKKTGGAQTYVERSNNSYYAPYGGWIGFMQSHGLKHTDLDDVEEGKAILAKLKELDRYDWEEEQKGK